jgi:hypothetical protein
VTVVVAVFLAVLGFTTSKLRSPEGSAETEMSVAMFLRVLGAGQTMFHASCGNGGYARTFEQLAMPPPGSSDGFIARSRADRLSRRFVVTLTPGGDGPNDCNGRPTSATFSATAVPVEFGRTGVRSFTLDSGNRIWYSQSPIAPAEPFEKTGKLLN